MERWKVSTSVVLVLVLLLLDVGSALNDEGMALLRFKEGIEDDPYGSLSNWEEEEGGRDPCSWNGVGCANGRVVYLVLANHHLKGKLSAELGKLIHLKYLVLNNNSLYGTIPREIGGLINLEVLDLGYNDFSGPLPSEIDNLLFLELLVVSGNNFVRDVPSGLHFLKLNDDGHIRGSHLSLGRKYIPRFGGNTSLRRLMLEHQVDLRNSGNTQSKWAARASLSDPAPGSPSPASSSAPAPSPRTAPASSSSPAPPPNERTNLLSIPDAQKKASKAWVFVVIGLALAAVVVAIISFIFIRNKKVVVKPWITGLSGQLRGALKTGAPSLKRRDLETACEDFSNIIGSLSDGELYKGTLSNGVEIAVNVITPASDWTKLSESQFKKKVVILSKFNHKNFINLLGYCEEEAPFTRMLVFEYAPNGTLYEHLHVRESQDLNWAARMRIIMGIAYCLEHMHQLRPSIILENLDSSMIWLTDDFAAKIADLELRSATSEHVADPGPSWSQLPEEASIVLKFGIILLEILSGKPRYSDEDGGIVNWANGYLKGSKPLKDMVDPSLSSINEVDFEKIVDLVKACIHPDPKQRLSMAKIVRRLRNITSITPEGAAPKLSPLWWAELEIISSEE